MFFKEESNLFLNEKHCYLPQKVANKFAKITKQPRM